MAAIEEKPKSEVVKALKRARTAIQNTREGAKAGAARAINTGLTVGSGYGVGLLRKKYGEGANNKLFIPNTEIEADLAAGVLLSLGGIVGIAGDKSDSVAAVGGGILAGCLAINALGDD